MNPAAPPERQLLVLAGGGHSHALLLRRWWMRPKLRPGHCCIVLVSRNSTALYSGMVPGRVAGLYPPDLPVIDLRQLSRRAGVMFVQAEITGLDPAARELHLRGRPSLRFDRLSLDVGAVTAVPAGAVPAAAVPAAGVAAAAAEQPVKPLEPFLDWLEARAVQAPLRIRGGGAAALELALACRARGWPVELLLRSSSLRLGSSTANRRGRALLQQAGVPVRQDVPAEQPADLACTGSRAPAWLAVSGLPIDPSSGRVLTDDDLRVQGHPDLFAVGDCAMLASAPRPASGVWAVRAAPLLADNLRRSLQPDGRTLRRWRPQPLALQLLADTSCRPPRALALYGPLAFGPRRWIWRWKDRIDRRFMAAFSAAAAGMPGGQPAEPMACRGCAAKLGAQPLASALARLATPSAVNGPAPDPAAGPEDAAVVGRNADGALLLQSVDGFPALLDDPWLNGRLTTLHACSDLWASGADVSSAQALVTLPAAAPRIQEELLLQTLAGVRSVLDPLGAGLLGGHTLEARDGAGLSLALTVNGVAPPGRSWAKGPLPPGSVLLLSRPIGSGVLFAAAMVGRARPAWLDAALLSMQADVTALLPLLERHGCCACTDVTGFGLLGHLAEMLGSGSGLTVSLRPQAIPAYEGALELLEQGFASSLAPANGAALALLDGAAPLRLEGPCSAAQQQLLIDPQTCGPLLAALPAAAAAAALADLQQAGFHQAALIGSVQPS